MLKDVWTSLPPTWACEDSSDGEASSIKPGAAELALSRRRHAAAVRRLRPFCASLNTGWIGRFAKINATYPSITSFTPSHE
jgi:hypothetical protein